MRRWTWPLTSFTAIILSVGSVAFLVGEDGLVADPLRAGQRAFAQDMHPAGKVWLLWSQHLSTSGPLWWRTEAGPFTDQACRAELKRASSRPKVAFTKWYDITPQYLEKLYGTAATPDKGTWIACWPAPFDFDRDLVDQ